MNCKISPMYNCEYTKPLYYMYCLKEYNDPRTILFYWGYTLPCNVSLSIKFFTGLPTYSSSELRGALLRASASGRTVINFSRGAIKVVSMLASDWDQKKQICMEKQFGQRTQNLHGFGNTAINLLRQVFWDGACVAGPHQVHSWSMPSGFDF